MRNPFEFLQRAEPFSPEELKAMGITTEVPSAHHEVEETISQFEACVQEVLYEPPYRLEEN